MLENNTNNNEQDLQPIDGQIGIEELYIREDENNTPEEEIYTEPIDGQFSFDDVLGSQPYQNDFLGRDANFDNQNGGELVLPTEHLENLSDFFKSEEDEKESEENKNNEVENFNEEQLTENNKESFCEDEENEQAFETETEENETQFDLEKNENQNSTYNQQTQTDDEGLRNFFKVDNT